MANEIIVTLTKFVIELKDLLNSSFFTTLLGFILGLMSQLILSKIKENKKNKKDNEEFRVFKEMISNVYIKPFHEELEKYSLESDRTTYSKLIPYTTSAENRLIFLKEEEISFLKSDNQFKMVRLIEFTKTYFKEARRVLNFYTFKPLDANNEDYDKDKDIQLKNIRILKLSYEKNKNDYMNLKTDLLLLKDELIKIQNY